MEQIEGSADYGGTVKPSQKHVYKAMYKQNVQGNFQVIPRNPSMLQNLTWKNYIRKITTETSISRQDLPLNPPIR